MDPRIDIQDGRVLALLENLRSLSHGRAQPVMEDIGRYLKTSMQLRFRSQQGPDGQAWWPSNRAAREGGQTLRLTNRLFRSLTWRAGPNFAEGGTNVKYAAAHNFGVRQLVTVRPHRRMTRRRDAENARVSVRSSQVRSFVRHMFLPARPFAGFSPADRTEILAILAEGIQALAERPGK